MIYLNDLKSIISNQNESSERQTKINKLKEKMDSVVEQGHWDFDDIIIIIMQFKFYNFLIVKCTFYQCKFKLIVMIIILLKIMMI